MKDFNYKERNFKARKELKKRRQKMIKLYKSGKTYKEISEILGCSSTAPYHAMKERGIKAKPSWRNNRKYSVNESFFDNIDTEEKAYWLGFISADGSIYNGKVSIALADKDYKHLEKFRKSLNSNHPIRYRSYNIKGYILNSCRIEISSVKMIKSLSKLGVTSNKVKTIKPICGLDENLMRHYFRGLVDGDGTIYPHRCSRSWIIGLAGNKYILNGFRKFINSKIKFNGKVKKQESCFDIRYNGILLPKCVAFLLYENSKIYLSRKKRLAGKLLKLKHSRTNLPHLKGIFENKLPLEVA